MTLNISHTRMRARDNCTLSTVMVEKVEHVQVCFTLHLRDQWSKWMQDGCKIYVDSYMASNGSCFMVTWTIFKSHLLEVGLTQNWETIALWNLTTVDFLYFNMYEDLAWIESHRNSIWLRAWSHMTSHYTKGPWPHYMILDVVLGRPLDISLGSHNFMILALGLCVKCPLVWQGRHRDIYSHDTWTLGRACHNNSYRASYNRYECPGCSSGTTKTTMWAKASVKSGPFTKCTMVVHPNCVKAMETAPQCVCLTNFIWCSTSNPKVSHDIFEKKNECQLTSTFSS